MFQLIGFFASPDHFFHFLRSLFRSISEPTLFPVNPPMMPPTTAPGTVPATAPRGPAAIPNPAPTFAPAAAPAAIPELVPITSFFRVLSSFRFMSTLSLRESGHLKGPRMYAQVIRPGFSKECFVQHLDCFFKLVLLLAECAILFVWRFVSDGSVQSIFVVPLDPFHGQAFNLADRFPRGGDAFQQGRRRRNSLCYADRHVDFGQPSYTAYRQMLFAVDRSDVRPSQRSATGTQYHSRNTEGSRSRHSRLAISYSLA